MRFLDPAQQWDESDPWVIRMRYYEALSEGSEKAHRENMARLKAQGEAIEVAWSRQGRRFFLVRWWLEFTGAALRERQFAALCAPPLSEAPQESDP